MIARQPTHIDGCLRKLLRTYAHGVEGIGEVRAVLKLVLIRLYELLPSFVLAVVVDGCTLDGDDEVLVVVLVYQDHVRGMSFEHAIDEQLLLQMVHRLADIGLGDQPPIAP